MPELQTQSDRQPPEHPPKTALGFADDDDRVGECLRGINEAVSQQQLQQLQNALTQHLHRDD